MTLNIDLFDPKSVQEAVKKLREYAIRLDNVSVELPTKLADKGVEIAQPVFDKAQYAGPDGDVTVTADTKTTTGGAVATVTASGPKVAFIEFGTGIVMGQGYPGDRPPGIVGLGEYGQGKGANPPWVYDASKGVGKNPPPGTSPYTDGKGKTVIFTRGNPPAAGMAAAAAEMRSELVPMVKGMLK